MPPFFDNLEPDTETHLHPTPRRCHGPQKCVFPEIGTNLNLLFPNTPPKRVYYI